MFVVLPSVQAAYQILSQLTVILYLIMYLLMFAAAIYLRYSQPNRPRPYRIPGGDIGMWLIGGVGFLRLAAGLRAELHPARPDLGRQPRPPIVELADRAHRLLRRAFRSSSTPCASRTGATPRADFAPFTWEAEGGHPGPAGLKRARRRVCSHYGRTAGESNVMAPCERRSCPVPMPSPIGASGRVTQAQGCKAARQCQLHSRISPRCRRIFSGVAVVTADGQVFAAGDTSYGFAIESISKVFTLALVMEQRRARGRARRRSARIRPACPSTR